jgi:gliding motility-associated-like protein
MIIRSLFLILPLFVCAFLQSQNYLKNWYFGTGTDGLRFDNNNIPQKINNKRLAVGFEGMIVVNNPITGDILFYSDGQNVVDKNHNLMVNGTGLTGYFSGAQCVQSCPIPGTCSKKFYLFTNSAWDYTPGQISYSIIDFTNNPLGEVTDKNSLLWNGPSDEAMCLINKPGSYDYWLISSIFSTAEYYVWPVTSAGVGTPSIYSFSNTGDSYQICYDKVSKRIAVTGGGNKHVTLIDFDPATGVLSNEKQIAGAYADCWAARFSPDGSKLYAAITVTGNVNPVLFQYDFTALNWTDMNTCCYAHDLKLGPDGKMYHIHTYDDNQPIAAIDFPNLSAIGNICNYHTMNFTPPFDGEVRRFPEFVVVPDPPIAATDISFSSGIPVVIPVLANDSDPQGDAFVIDAIIKQPQLGTALISGNNISYTQLSGSTCGNADTLIYRIKDINCDTDTALVIINFNACSTTCATKEDFRTSRNACTTSLIELETTAPAGSYTDIKWDMGDGTIKTGLPKFSYNYSNYGNYTVTMILLKPTCNDTVTKRITIDITSEDLIVTKDTVICYGSSKKINAIPALSFCWTPTNYLDDPFISEPTTSTPKTITYYYTAEVTGANLIVNSDFSLGNIGFTSDYSFANPNLTEGEYFVDSSPQAWNGSLSDCPDHTSGNGNMLLVNGSPVPDLNVWAQTVAVTPNTNYSFSTWIQALWPPNPAILKFSINGNDIGSTIIASLPTCSWTQFYTTWNSGNNTSAAISIVNKNTEILGNDFALDDISLAPLFMKRDSIVIVVDSPAVKTNDNSAICSNKSVQLNTVGANNYSWLPVTGLSNPNISNPIAAPTATTTYVVTGISPNGCTARDTVTIAVKTQPDFAVSPGFSTCSNIPLQLNASGGDAYQWSPANLLNNPTIQNPVATIGSNTLFTVTITDTVCKVSKDLTTTVTLLPSPNVQIDDPKEIDCSNPAIQLNATGASQYNWSPPSGLNNSNVNNPIVSIDTTTTYIVRGTGSNGCFGYDTATVKVSKKGTLLFDMPNAFTPNNDGHNDCFGLGRFSGFVQSFQLSIYNRWGQRVFYTNNPGSCWDGLLKGNIQDSGGYMYLLKAKTSCGNIDKKGLVMLLR